MGPMVALLAAATGVVGLAVGIRQPWLSALAAALVALAGLVGP